VVGIALYLLVATVIYKKAWFFSFYSFVKFIIILIISFAAGLNLAPKNIQDLPLTNLQLSLIIQAAIFAILWRVVSFRKIFFATTDSVFSLNRFIFTHRIDRVLNIVPSLVVSFFITFFLFTLLVTASTSIPPLAASIDDSKIVKPISYKIYFAKIFNGKIFEGIVFKLPTAPEVPEDPGGTDPNQPQNPTSPPTGEQTTSPVPTSRTGMTFVPPIARTNTPTPVSQTVGSGRISTPTPTIRQNSITTTQKQALINTPTPTRIQVPPTSAPLPTSAPTARPTAATISTSQAEQDIFRKTNEERAKAGLPALILDGTLTSVARAHSQDMSSRNFFGHVNPDGKNSFDRIKEAGVTYSSAGENIAGGPTADIIMTNWMNSSGHRANILKSSFGKVGIGVAKDSKYGLLATQVFTN